MYVAAPRHVEGKGKEGVASKSTSETQNPPDDHPVFEKVHLKLPLKSMLYPLCVCVCVCACVYVSVCVVCVCVCPPPAGEHMDSS